MLIRKMTDDECLRTLPQVVLGRLACAEGGQPYVVPVYLASDGKYLYGFSSLGKKIECMRANPSVCVEIDDLKSDDDWATLIVFGTYQELPDTSQYEATRMLAHELLRKRAMWWQPASVAVACTEQEKAFAPIFYRIRIDRITGHRATPEPCPRCSSPAKRRGLLSHVIRSRSLINALFWLAISAVFLS
jgi:nitroimidazol reductase NimA-like FMN-containing flavoprotein (pyridoxamine 5'-phosphate oxidase superfamily)